MNNKVKAMLKVPYEPKKNNRWIVQFPDYLPIPEYVVKYVSRLSWERESFMAPITWDDLIIKLYDPITPSTSQILHEYFIRSKTNSKTITFNINKLGPVGDIVQQTVITGAITGIDFGECDYENDDVSLIVLNFRIYNVTLNF